MINEILPFVTLDHIWLDLSDFSLDTSSIYSVVHRTPTESFLSLASSSNGLENISYRALIAPS